MDGLTRPAAEPVPVEPYSEEEIAALLATCEGWKFTRVRDAAIMQLLLCTGMRRAEVAAITRDKIDMTERRRDSRQGQGQGRRKSAGRAL